MNIAIAVAIVAGAFGVVQATIARFTGAIAARQEACRSDIEFCDRLIKQIAELGQAANGYGIHLGNRDETRSPDRRWEAMRPLLEAHGVTFGTVQSLPLGSPARPAVERVLAIVEEMTEDRRPAMTRREEWLERSDVVRVALQQLGRERAYRSAQLAAAGKLPWQRNAAAERVTE